MDDDAFGLFECPYCEEEYEWGEAPKTTTKKKTTKYNFKSKEIIKNRTQNIGSNINSNSHKREFIQTSEYTALNFASLATNTFLIFVIFIGLNSNSWYGFSYTDDEDSEAEFEASFGLSYVEYTITDNERSNYLDEDNTYAYFGGAIEGYEAQLELAKIQQEFTDDMCKDWEENDECETMMTQAQESVDYWNSWNTSGNFLFFLLFFSLISFIVIVSFKILVFLNHNDWLTSNDEMLRIFNKIDKIASSVIYSILIIGLLMYWLFVPNVENWWDIMDNDVPTGLSSGLGFIWWVTMLTSLGCLTLTSFESISKIKA